MKFAKAPAENVELLDRVVGPMPAAQRKTMFGYAAYFAGGKLAVGLFADGVCMKLAPEDRAKALGLDGVTEFAPMQGRVMREYVFFTRAALKDEARLRSWAQKSVLYALQVGGGGRPTAKPRPRRA